MNNVFGGLLQLGAAPFNIITFNLAAAADIPAFFGGVNWRETFLGWAGEVRECYSRRTQPPFC